MFAGGMAKASDPSKLVERLALIINRTSSTRLENVGPGEGGLSCHSEKLGFYPDGDGGVSEEFSDVVEFASSCHPGYSVECAFEKINAGSVIHVQAREIRWNQKLGKEWISVMSGDKI